MTPCCTPQACAQARDADADDRLHTYELGARQVRQRVASHECHEILPESTSPKAFLLARHVSHCNVSRGACIRLTHFTSVEPPQAQSLEACHRLKNTVSSRRALCRATSCEQALSCPTRSPAPTLPFASHRPIRFPPFSLSSLAPGDRPRRWASSRARSMPTGTSRCNSPHAECSTGLGMWRGYPATFSLSECMDAYT
eukprot:3338961-Pleurochrysis_carterae.AAC.1